MNKENVLLNILSILEGTFLYLDVFLRELIDIIACSGYERRFFTQFVARLNQLRALGASAIELKEFERIDDTIYSMHFSSTTYNIRVLYGFATSGLPLLLLAFFERGGKSKTDYTAYIPVAHARLEGYNECSS